MTFNLSKNPSTNNYFTNNTFDDNRHSGLQPLKVIYSKRNKFYIEPFSDSVMLTTSYLQHSNRSYPLKSIKTLQIIKLHSRPSIITQKKTSLLGLMTMSIGFVLTLSPLLLFFRILGLLGVVSTMAYLAHFFWNILHQQTGEYGLLIVIQQKVKIKRVITSHSLKAIQMTYRAVLERLENCDPIAGLLFVDMYTGEVHSDCHLSSHCKSGTNLNDD